MNEDDIDKEIWNGLDEKITELSKFDFESKFKELKTFTFKIPEDPMSIGIHGMHKIISDLQRSDDSIYQMTKDAIHHLHSCEIVYGKIVVLFDRAKNEILIGDKEIQELRNKELQNAKCEIKLKEKHFILKKMELLLDMSKNFVTEVELTSNQLKSASDKLSRQITMIDQQIKIGEIGRLSIPLDKYVKLGYKNKIEP